jgi:NTE family protein
VGSQYLAGVEYYHPITPTSNWFVAPRLEGNSNQLNLYQDTTLTASYRLREALAGIDSGYGFGNTGELRLGYEGGYEHLSPEIGNSAVLPTVSGGTGDVRLQFELQTVDSPVIPRSGSSLQAYTKWFNVNPAAKAGFPLSEVQSLNFFRVSQPTSLFLGAFGGSSYGRKTGIPAFSLGGSQRLVAWSSNELLTNQYFLGQAGLIHELVKLPPFLGTSVDLIGMFEVGKTYRLPTGSQPPNLPMDGAVGFLMNTIFGPVELAGAVGEYGRGRFFFRIGRTF